MKKTILFTGLACLTFSITNAQTPVITNGSFETWTASSGSLELEAPTSWSGSDKLISDMSMMLAIAGYDVTPQKQVYKITSPSATDGAMLAEIVTKNTGPDLGFLPGVMANGKIEVNGPALLAWMSSGDGDITSIFDINNASPMFGKRVDSVKVDATCWGDSPLNGAMSVSAMKTVDGESIVIGTGVVSFANTTTMSSTLTEYTAHINYTGGHPEEVDTLVVLFLSSTIDTEDPDGEGDVNYVRIDNVRLFTSTPSSINPIPTADLGITVYPNPAREYITFNNSANNKNLVINVYSFTGQIMEQRPLTNGENTISTIQYAQGMYAYEIIDTDSRLRQTGQFVR